MANKNTDVPFTPESIGVVRVLDALNSLAAHHPSDSSSPWELWCDRVVKWLLILSGSAFALLCALAGAAYFDYKFPNIGFVAGYVGFAAMVFALLSLVIQIGSGLVLISRFQPYSDRVRTYECRKDYFNVSSLRGFDDDFLRKADKWLAFKQEMMESRQALFFGGSDKVALFALVAGAWAIWEKVGKELVSFVNYPLIVGCSLLVGLSIGGFVNRLILIRLAYQRGLIKLALEY